MARENPLNNHDDIEQNMANAFRKAGEQASMRLPKLVDLPIEQNQNDTDTILDGMEALQKFLMNFEEEFGNVSKDRRGYAKQERGPQQGSGLPHHPLLGDTQRLDGVFPEESSEPTVNPVIAQELEEYLENHPELVNNPQLRMALENQKRMQQQMSNTITPAPP